jgi:hypothetical protein
MEGETATKKEIIQEFTARRERIKQHCVHHLLKQNRTIGELIRNALKNHSYSKF